MSVIRSIHASVLSGLVVAALSSAAFAANDSAKTAAAQPAPAAKTAAVAASTAPAAAPAAPAAAPATAAAAAAPAASSAKAGTAGRSCDEVKAEIDGKLAAKGVKGYTLDVVAKDEVKDAKVVGSCEGGASKITYKKA